jgi:Zn-dependent protease
MLFSVISGSNNGRETVILLMFYVFAVLSALILHEISHGWVAYKCGDPTAKFAGRLSLNPAKHLDPVGALMFVLVGFGWANPVPINPYNFRNFKRGCFLVSVAGITTNLVIAFLASPFYVLLIDTLWGQLFAYILIMNVSFAVFNFLPVPPLDGFNIWASLAKPGNRAIIWLRNNQMMMLIMLLIVLQLTGVFGIMRSAVLNLFLSAWGFIK